MPLLEVRDLRTYFRTDAGVAQAVDGVSFHVEEGETLGIVGESGCGKTVTSLSLMGLIPDPPGEIVSGSSIRFGGEELVGASNARLREIRGNEMSMIFQEPMTSLNPVFTVGNQIAEALRTHRGLSKRDARTVSVVCSKRSVFRTPISASTSIPISSRGDAAEGHDRHGPVVRAPAPDRDEPTTALDVTIQAQILDLLAGLRRTHGMAVLLITHDLGVVAEVCDRVVVMYAGQVVETGTVDEIFADPRHPYTQGLLASLPELGGEIGSSIRSRGSYRVL